MAASEQASAARTMTLDVFRYQPDQDEEPTFQQYEVPYRDDWVVLDALKKTTALGPVAPYFKVVMACVAG